MIREKADVRHPLYLGHFVAIQDANGMVDSFGEFKVASKVTMFSEVSNFWDTFFLLLLSFINILQIFCLKIR